MDRYKAVEIFLTLLCIAGMILTWGCSQYVVTETYTSEAVTYSVVAKQNLFLYYTSLKPFELVTPTMTFVAGGMEAYPDPNSIKYAVEGAVEGLRGL